MGLPTWLFALPLVLSTAGISTFLGARAQLFDRPFDGIHLYQAGALDAFLPGKCQRALVAKIDCPEYVRTFADLRYRESLQDEELADSICTDTCNDSLRTWFNNVTANCHGVSAVGGKTPARFGGYMWAAWNETCMRDPETDAYCIDIMHDFAVVDDVTQMPRDQLCHPCYQRRLAMMQASQFSVYDESYKERLNYVYGQCGGHGPIGVPPPIE